MSTGALYLLPVPLGDVPPALSLAAPTLDKLRSLRHFVAENAKSARAALKAAEHPLPLREIEIRELNEHTPDSALSELLTAARDGHELGLVSEAGCPAVADPGAKLVALAHREGIRVVPMVGPSSLLLALMASGLNGQSFTFNGYLPAKEPARAAALRRLENTSRTSRCVQIFIETPYRNEAMLEAIVATCSPNTRLCVATDLTLPSEWISMAPLAEWRSGRTRPPLDRRPTVFLLEAG